MTPSFYWASRFPPTGPYKTMNESIKTSEVGSNVRQLVLEDDMINFQRRQWMIEALDRKEIPSQFPSWDKMVEELIQPEYCSQVNVAAFCLGEQPKTAENIMSLRLLYLRFVLVKQVVEKYG
jgi:hypothetical protein